MKSPKFRELDKRFPPKSPYLGYSITMTSSSGATSHEHKHGGLATKLIKITRFFLQ